MAADSGYMVAVYILVPAMLVGGLCLLLYICCSKRYRLNWFERTLLEAHEERSSEKEYINASATRGSSSTAQTSVGDHGSMHHSSLHSVHISGMGSDSSATSGSIPSISHPVAGPQPSITSSTSSKITPVLNTPDTAPIIPPVIASSHPSTPGSEASADQQFWVPSTIIQKKRAQSLIPQLLQPQDSTEDSGQCHSSVTCRFFITQVSSLY